MENMSVRRATFKLCVLTLSLWLVTAAARADTVLDWNTIAVNTAVANKQNPFAQARFAAITQLAVFEAVNAITQDYQPYIGSITAPPGASAEAAAIEAAYKVLITTFPTSTRPRCWMPIEPIRCRRYPTAKPRRTASPQATPLRWRSSPCAPTTARRPRNSRFPARRFRANTRPRRVVQL